MDHSPWGHKEGDMTEHAHTHTYIFFSIIVYYQILSIVPCTIQ